ncbi:radical SAM protein [Cytophagaceae bacterium ABcell3]|nr:radical SAM protein [Cytophagaceae bacterium ABcell3]
MQFIVNSDPSLQTPAHGQFLRRTSVEDYFVDAWAGENISKQETHGDLEITISENGVFGLIELPYKEGEVEEITSGLYRQVFSYLENHPNHYLLRVWHYVPNILKPVSNSPDANIYQQFNRGRHSAFVEYYSQQLHSIAVPVASAVGYTSDKIRLEFLAVENQPVFLENKDQVAARHYSKKYGECPPLFSRGAIYKNLNQTVLISAGTASVVGENSLHTNLYDQVNQTIHNLRVLGSQFNLKKYGVQYGFALEDIVLLRTYYKNEEDAAFLRQYLKKVVSPSCKLSFMKADVCRDELLVEMEAVFVKKGEFEEIGKPKYFLEDGKIRTESFELHIAEHCNLRCRDCCNISPFNPQKFMRVSEVDEICKFIKNNLRPDVFKIAGGEPTLHPELDEIIRVVKSHGVTEQVRVVSNGLLIHKMSEAFWQQIDQLTISNYVSAPVKPKTLELIKNKARQYGIVVNIKKVDQFNEIFIDEPFTDKSQVQVIYDDCWMRHRCHIIRNGYFYKCTRAAYMDEYLGMLKKDQKLSSGTYSQLDGIPIDTPNFKEKVLAFLNDNKPLNSCRYCLGVSGGLRENVQLSKKEVSSQFA